MIRLWMRFFMTKNTTNVLFAHKERDCKTWRKEMKPFEVKESSYISGDGVNHITKTPKVTGKGQKYFINKFLAMQK